MVGRGASLVVVSGPPGTGKSTFAAELAERVHLPCIGKDRIKEALFDELGWSDRDWSRRVGGAATRVVLALAETFLRAGCTCILDSNFRPEYATSDFLALQERVGFHPIQVLCRCEGPVLVQRFAQRAASAERHPGHRDGENVAEFVPELMLGAYAPLGIDGPVFHLDTTAFDPTAWRQVLDWVCKALNERPASRLTQ